MHDLDDAAQLARLLNALRPWLGHLVLVGGWAHRLYRLHELAGQPDYVPVRTRDVDFALSPDAPLPGDIGAALADAGFGPVFRGDHTPPITHYELGEDGFYAEFLTVLKGSGIRRSGQPDVTLRKAGISAQKLRYLDLLLVAPWSVHIGSDAGIPVEQPIDVLLPNPASFIVQKLLIHHDRPYRKKAQDLLYIHDTIELFIEQLDELRSIWQQHIQPAMPARTSMRAGVIAQSLFIQVTDSIREAALIQQSRRLSPETLRATSAYGLGEMLRS